LTVILGNTGLLQAGLPREDRRSELLAATEKAARRGAELTTKMLGFSRQTALRLQPSNLNTAIEEAVALLRRTIDPRIHLQTRPDLVILDLTMPVLSGRDALRKLVQIDPSVRVLFASGFSADHLDGPERDHVLGFVGKPYSCDDLARAVRTALDHAGDRPARPPAEVASAELDSPVYV
jgi:DNA-binding NarL/FixJ family response regulator